MPELAGPDRETVTKPGSIEAPALVPGTGGGTPPRQPDQSPAALPETPSPAAPAPPPDLSSPPVTTAPSTAPPASSPATPATPVDVAPARAPERSTPSNPIIRYVRDYEGGDCFFLTPTNVGTRAAEVEGFGSTPAAFQAFDEAFKRALGFEAKISLRLLSDAQCPAVTFLRKVGIDAARAPKLEIGAFSLKEDEPLSGSVKDFGSQHIEVILVADDGYVYNLSEYLKRENDAVTFSLRLQRPEGRRAKPQLVVAIASPKPLALLATGKPIAADALFPLLIDEARTLGFPLEIAVKYFRLEG
jgi:hypothetical protein